MFSHNFYTQKLGAIPIPPKKNYQNLHMTDEKNNQKQGRLCDYCNQSKAVLYCRADSAKLCFSCDREVHSANQLFTKHTRSQLCDACDDSPASIFCETEKSVFCSNCDWESHKPPSSSLHNRRPVEGFTGCPSVNELVSFVGIEDLGDKASILNEDDGWMDLLSWETPVIISFDDLFVASDSDHGFKPTDVLSLPKNRNACCGQHMEEVLHQLRELAKSEPTFSFKKPDGEAVNGFQSRIPDTDGFLLPGSVNTSCKNESDPISFPAYQLNALKCFGDNVETTNRIFVPFSQLAGHSEETAVVPDNHIGSSMTIAVSDSLENQQHQVDARTVSELPKVAFHELNSQERDSAISRYKEKRKTRRFDKHIRYESRKVRAESRTRIKGRFAKIEH